MKSKSRPRILLIRTGGTVGLLPGGKGFAANPTRLVPELRSLARVRVVTPFLLDSSSMTPDHWVQLARVVAKEMSRVDGFVITHGTDTMAYTGAALSFLLEGLRKPVVLTGAQRPLVNLRNDARSNLIDAVEVATKELPEVVVCFGGHVLRANRARKRSLVDYRAFESPNFPLLGEIGAVLSLHHDRIRKPSGRFRVSEKLEARVLHLRLSPGLLGSSLQGIERGGVRGVVLEAFGAGNIPLTHGGTLDALHRLSGLGVPVVIVSGSEHGRADLSLYEGGRAAQSLGAICAGDMTAEATVVKLMIALGRARTVAEAAALMRCDWAGELTTEDSG